MNELPLKVLFIDRDGTIIYEPDDFQVDDLKKVKFVPNVIRVLNELRNEGYEITSETDSELIAHLVHFYKKDTQDTLQALMRATHELSGAYSIAVVCKQEKGKVYAARQKSPLLVGLGIEENFVASDPLAIVNITEKFHMLKDGDFAVVTKEDEIGRAHV